MKPVLPLLWRIEAKSGDGKTVTLGKYATEAEAENDRERYTAEGYYRKIKIVALPPPPAPPEGGPVIPGAASKTPSGK